MAHSLSASVVSAAFALILTCEEGHLAPAEMDLSEFPAPPLTCSYFTTPCKEKKFVIWLIPVSLRNSTDPLIPPA